MIPNFFDKAVCALDFETTGLNVDVGDRAIELGIVKQFPDGQIQTWSNLLNPERDIPYTSQRIHGISNAMVESAPYFQDVFPEISDILEGSHIVAHNASFDLTILKMECEKNQLSLPKMGNVFDTLTFARHIFGLPRCNLSIVSERFGVPVQNAHRALHDAENTILVFQKMCSVLRDNIDISTGDDLPTLLERFMPQSPLRNAKEAIISEAIQTKSPVLIDYVSANPERPLIQQRKVVPLKLDGMRVHVFCHLRKAERTLRMKRFFKVKALPQEEGINSVI
jgi:DNA polymerase III epsilon subunit family exonuclease